MSSYISVFYYYTATTAENILSLVLRLVPQHFLGSTFFLIAFRFLHSQNFSSEFLKMH